jgi:uncharacterized protein (DUF924 family)
MERWQDVLEFWFGDTRVSSYPPAERLHLWFEKSEATDRLIEGRFGCDLERAEAGALFDWERFARGRLALIVLLDQFSRNIHRGTPRAFASDDKVLALCLDGIAQKMDTQLTLIERVFFYLPMEHSEDLSIQRCSVQTYKQLIAHAPRERISSFQSFLDYAVKHCEVIERFGRFPHRNAILGRASTPEEIAFLARPGSSF